MMLLWKFQMGKRVPFSGQQLDLDDIAVHYSDVEASLRQHFLHISKLGDRFVGFTSTELFEVLEHRLEEQSRSGVLSILAALEAAFRIDYLQRVYTKKKDILSRTFRELYKEKGSRVSLDEEILNAWLEHSDARNSLVGELKGAFKYRHWLAHGRYWKPKLGQRYDYHSVYELAVSILNSFPFS